MKDYVLELVKKYRDRGLLVDTNLLLLLFIGAFNRDLIGKDKRLAAYAPEDFDALIALMDFFPKRLITTPNVLTELSNLSGHLLQTNFCNVFASTVDLLLEEFRPSLEVLSVPEMRRYGLTDGAISVVAKGKYLVLTDDFPLAGQLAKSGVDCINFNHVRTRAWHLSQ